MIFKEYKEPLYWYLRKVLYSHEDTDDAMQNTFVKVYQKIGQFREDSSLKTWIFSIGYREALQIIRKKKQRNNGYYEEVESVVNELTAEPYFKGNEIHKMLMNAVQSLPERQRQIFELKYFQEMSYREISKITEITEGGLKASYYHAVHKIQDYLKQKIVLK
nr:sigma-70 family RNA polymerase sigma factor [Membranihabitans maritimus]